MDFFAQKRTTHIERIYDIDYLLILTKFLFYKSIFIIC